MPGPPPKPSTQRRRRNPTAGEEKLSRSTRIERGEVVRPEAADDWHPIARQWFESLASSGQASLYESSDWAMAAVLAESISREMNPKPVVDKDGNVTMVSVPVLGATLSAFLKGCAGLLVTEGDRRRAAVELQRPQPEQEAPASVTNLRAWKESLSG